MAWDTEVLNQDNPMLVKIFPFAVVCISTALNPEANVKVGNIILAQAAFVHLRPLESFPKRSARARQQCGAWLHVHYFTLPRTKMAWNRQNLYAKQTGERRFVQTMMAGVVETAKHPRSL